MLAVMAQHDELAKILLDRTEAERTKASVTLRRTLAELQESRGRRARAEEALRIIEERLQVILNAARMAYWEWDFTTDTVSASDSMDELCAYRPARGSRPAAGALVLIHPDDQHGHQEKDPQLPLGKVGPGTIPFALSAHAMGR